MIELRGPDGLWGVPMPDYSDYDDPSWNTGLTQEQTPYGAGWTDGRRLPGQARLTLRTQVGALSPGECDRRCSEVMAALLVATGLRDAARSPRYLITQGVLGEAGSKTARGGTSRLLTVTLALRDPYWHDTDTDSSTDLYP